MGCVTMQKKMKKRPSRIVATTISALSILGSTSETAAATTEQAVYLRGNKASNDLPDVPFQKGSSNGDQASIEQHPQRSLKKTDTKKTSDSSAGAGGGGGSSSTPIRPPISIDPRKHLHALPLNARSALLPNMANMDGAQSGGLPMPSQQAPQPPYYPDFTSQKCVNDDSFPEHYLYETRVFFSHSVQECCEAHFNGGDVEHCTKATMFGVSVGGMAPLAGVGVSGGMGMKKKKDAYRSHPIQPVHPNEHMGPHDMVPVSGGMHAVSDTAHLATLGKKKKPMMHHDTGWRTAATTDGASSWADDGGKSGKSTGSDSWHGGGGDSSLPSWWQPSGGGKSGKNDDWYGDSEAKSGKAEGDSWYGGDDWYADDAKSGKSVWHGADDDTWWQDASEDENWHGGNGSNWNQPPNGSSSQFNYCGISFADANTKCSTPCPNGLDNMCPQGETCFADADGCPSYVGGGQLPSGNDGFGYLAPAKEGMQTNSNAWNGGGKKQIKCLSEDDEWYTTQVDGNDDWSPSPGEDDYGYDYDYGDDWYGYDDDWWGDGDDGEWHRQLDAKSAKNGAGVAQFNAWMPSPPQGGWGGPDKNDQGYWGGPDSKSSKGGNGWAPPPPNRGWAPEKPRGWGGGGSGTSGKVVESGGWVQPPPPNAWSPDAKSAKDDKGGGWDQGWDSKQAKAAEPWSPSWQDAKSAKSKSPKAKSPKAPKSHKTVKSSGGYWNQHPSCYPTYMPTPSTNGGGGWPTRAPFGDGNMPTDAPQGAASYPPTGAMPTVPPNKPTYAPTPEGGNMTWPTYSPTPSGGGMPTYSPTGDVTPTWSPTPEGGPKYPTYSPTPGGTTSRMPSYPPSNKGTTTPPAMPTDFPTFNPSIIPTPEPNKGGEDPTAMPTFMPSKSEEAPAETPTEMPTFMPSINPTTPAPQEVEEFPTSMPTFLPSHSPTMDGTHAPYDLLVWGSPSSISQPEENGNILIPLETTIDGIDASAGSRYSLVIHPDGTAYSTGIIPDPKGQNYQGHLGIRNPDLVEGQNMWQEISRVFDPDLGGVTFPPRFKHAFAGVENTQGKGDIHSVLLDGKGNAWVFGANDQGQLCLGDVTDRMIPEKIEITHQGKSKHIIDVAIGGQHTLLLTKDGTVYGCGSNEYGQLGLGETLPNSIVPLELYGSLLESPATSISAGKDHSVIIANDKMYAMGSNEFGQLCVDTNGENVWYPRSFDIEEKVAMAFEATRYSSYILYVDGSVNSCGRNLYGQLGDGSNDDAFLATVQMPEGWDVVRLLGVGPSSYSVFFVAITAEGRSEDETVWGTGLNDYGQLGVGDEDNRSVPTRVILQDEVVMHIISTAEDHSLTLKEGGVAKTPTYAPTAPGTYPTYSPTAEGTLAPTEMGHDFYFWGAPEVVGQPVDTPDVTVPLNVGGGVTYSGAGSKYTIIILQDGSALSAGYVENLDDYQGHLGIDPNAVQQGVNEFQPIDQIYDPNKADPNDNTNALVDAPRWDKVFGGVENVPDTGDIHTILLDDDGNAYAFGSNEVGQLCLGDDVDRMIPEMIDVGCGKVIDVAIGGEHTLLLLDDGSVYGCGSNRMGQLGLGKKQAGFSPTIVDDLPPVSSISAGHSHSLFVAEDDGIYFTGSNEYGQLCTDTDGENILTPTALDVNKGPVISLEAIKESSFILYEDGSVNACGRNNFGQLGNGTNQDSNQDQYLVAVETEGKVVRLLGVGPSAQSVFFVTDDEYVWGTGLNDRGQLGVGDTDNRNLPTRVSFGDLVEIYQITNSEVHTVALGNVVGTIPPTPSPVSDAAVPTYAPTYSPTEVTSPAPTRAGYNLYFWGAPDSIGQDSQEDALIPILSGENVIDASGGSKYTVIILQDGSALSAGYIDSLQDYQGHLGRDEDNVVQGVNEMQPIGRVYDADASTIVDAPRFDRVFAGVENTPDSGVIHTILLDVQGRAWATGSNSNGQLCLGDGVEKVMIPERIPIEGRIVDVAIGGEHTLFLDEFGNVYGCGSNAVGQLGLGTTEQTLSVPTIVDSLSSVASISAGHSHSLFKTDDGIYFTGSNEYGQLCADTNGQDLLSPASIPDILIENVVSFEATKFSSYILYVDGTVNSCGSNEFGQLGDGTNANQLLAEVELGSHVARLLGVGPSAESVFFVTNDEKVWGTGLNDRGQLGVGDVEDRNLPARVLFQDRVILEVLSGSGDHTVALGLESGTTFEPTMAPRFPTVSPVVESTSYPTMGPKEGQDLFLWGAPKAVGQDIPDDVLRPLFIEEDAVWLSAGSRYSLVVLADGTALSSGLIDSTGLVDSLGNYQGHLGLSEQDIIAGVNEFRAIPQVYDPEELSFFSPAFDKAFAGVENSPDSGVIHSILLDRQGRAWATGSNNKGQLCLGDGDNVNRMVPEKIPIEGRVVDVAIGGEYTLLLLDDGSVYGCGSNAFGQIGLGKNVMDTSSPTKIDVFNSPVMTISAGHSHSLFTAEDGIYLTGSNEYGQLCADTSGENIYIPGALQVDQRVAIAFEATKFSSYIMYDDGSVNACGRNNFGQLGDGTDQDQLIAEVDLGGQVARLLGVGPSAESVFFIMTDERVWGTGLNDRGQLGVGDKDNRNMPTQVKFGSEVLLEMISAGQDHTLALGAKIGDTPQPTLSPVMIATPQPTKSPVTIATPNPVENLTKSPSYNPTFSQFPSVGVPVLSAPPTTYAPTKFGGDVPTSNSPSTMAPTGDATLMYYWGAPGSVGSSSFEDITTPISSDINVVDVTAGSKYSIILLSDGTAQSAGFVDSKDDYNGYLGVRGSDISEGANSWSGITDVFDGEELMPAPFFVQAFAGAENNLLSPGTIHSLLIDEDGRAWVTGSNSKGQLCLGDDGDRLIPQQIPIDGRIISAAIGSEHTLLLIEDGSVYGCGSNEVGQLGLGADVQEVNIPTLVEGLGVVESLSAGLGHSLFVAEDFLYVAGSNFYGQLCVGNQVGDNVMSPVIVFFDEDTEIDATTVATFEAIKTSSFILFKDGSVGSCGRNNFGQLGDGSNEDRARTVIEPLPDSSPIRKLGVGPSSESVFFVNDIGDTYATGLNDRGQLGVGDNVNKNTLTPVSFDNSVVVEKISASEDHTMSR